MRAQRPYTDDATIRMPESSTQEVLAGLVERRAECFERAAASALSRCSLLPAPQQGCA